MTGRTTPGGARFGAAIAESILTAACAAAGLDATGFEPMRLGENALFYLPGSDVVVRIARSMHYWTDAVNEVNVARWLADEKFPAAEVYPIHQPIEILGHPATFWRFIKGRPGARGDLPILASVLRRLHSLPTPNSFALPSEQILGRVEGRIHLAPIPRSDRQFLMALLGNLKDEVSALTFPLPLAPTHGDAHSENLMIREDAAFLIDFERFAWGQPEWDLAMTATEYLSAGWWTPAEYRAFSEAYGYDVTDWNGFDVLRRVHELKMTTWLMQNIGESREIADEYRKRMHSIRTGERSAWRPF